MKDGRILSGLIRERNPNAVVLEMIGETITIGRPDIEEETTSTLSIMPEGQLDAISETNTIDLFGFLMSTAPPDVQ